MTVMKRALLAAAFSLASALPLAAAEKPQLTVYTYDSFVSDWGPGPKIEAGFEKICGCDLKFVAPGDSAAVLSRLRLEGANSKADVVIGLDTNLVAQAEKSGLFQAHGVDIGKLDLPVAWDATTYVPFDWGYFAFVYDTQKLKQAPASFAELLKADKNLKIVIQDPRSSTPGLGLLMWVKAVYGDKAGEVWAKLQPRIVTVTKGWSEAYGMFLKGQADMVLSYTTSPAYHLIAEKKDHYKAATFAEGHYMQVELAAMTKATKNKALAKAFLGYLTSDEAQAILPVTNWMYPAKTPKAGLPKGFETLAKPAKAILLPAGDVPALRKVALDEWLEALSQ